MMRAATSNFESCRFSSDNLRPADRVPFYCDVVGRMLGRMEAEAVGERFSCDARFYRSPDLSVTYVTSSAIRGNRTREMTEGHQELCLVVNFEGAATFSHLGREATITAGDALLISAADPFHMDRTASRRSYISVSRAMLAPMLATPDAALMSVIPSTIEPLRLLSGYIDLLLNGSTVLETGELRRLAVHHVYDLLALTVGATRAAAEIAAGRGLRAARVRAIKADIAQNLGGDVTATGLSERHRVSPRYIRKLFESENTSLSQFVLGQRLAGIHRMLDDPRYADRTIADLALAIGFGDISTFNREFRRRFGVTPSDVRAATGRIARKP